MRNIIKPQISIIMSVYNDAIYIRAAIESVMRQKFRDWELIIVDDASTDDTPAVIHKYRKLDKRIRYEKLLINCGISTCLNKGIKISSGNFIARIDSDDLWIDNNKLQKQLILMKNNSNYGLVGTWAKVIDNNNKQLYDLSYPAEDLIIRNQMLKHNCFVSSSVLIRKELLIKVGLYEITSRVTEDYKLWLKLGTVGKFCNIPEYMTWYRINSKGISQNQNIEQINYSLRVIKKYRKIYPHYYQAFILWNLRKYYPKWLKGSLSRKLNPIK